MATSPSRHYDRQLDQICRKEDRLFADCEREERPSTGLLAKIEAKIPAKLVGTMDLAFYKAFQVLFEKGTGLLRRTIAEKKLKADRFIREYYLKEHPTAERVEAFYKSARLGGVLSTLLATAEGCVLGLLGLGLPDIPILMSLLLRTVYQTALRYGFRYDSQQERYFILLVLSAALAKGNERKEYSLRADQVGRAIDRKEWFSFNLNEQMQETSKALARSMLVPKFIQGYTFVGVVGGLHNFSASRRVANMANLKYQRRFLEKKKREG
ncbi:MAG: EcsC family protein [Oscillospiraceae bacterium]